MKISERLSHIAKQKRPVRPLFFRLSKQRDAKRLSTLLSSGKVTFVVDDFLEQQKELYAILNPDLVTQKDFIKKRRRKIGAGNRLIQPALSGVWVYYPWLSTIVHLLDEKDFHKVRTARNKYLITEEEQRIFYHSCVGIGGLSVGSSVILTIVLEGGARHIRLADMDRLALSNTNRIRTSLSELGSLKVEMAARQIYEVNPFVTIDIIPRGLTDDTLRQFFVGHPKLDVVIDELDDLSVKYRLREWARRMGIPVVMAADNGSSGVIDIERYDLSRKTRFFHGRLGNVTRKTFAKLNKFETGKMITRHVGPENINERMQYSLMEMGKTITSWPQLGGTAMLNSAAVSYVIRRILNHQPLEKNRAIVSLDEKLEPLYATPSAVAKRKKVERFFRKTFGL